MSEHMVRGLSKSDVSQQRYSNHSVQAARDNVDKVEVSLQRSSLSQLRTAEQRGEQISISEKQVLQAIEKAIKEMQGPYTYLEYSIHEQTRQISVKVHDQETGEIIREIPPEKTLDFVAKLWEMAGILVDERR